MVELIIIIVILSIVALIVRSNSRKNSWLRVNSISGGRVKLYTDHTHHFKAIINNAPETISVEVCDTQGRVLSKKMVDSHCYISNASLCEELPTGHYIFNIKNRTESFSRQLHVSSNLSKELRVRRRLK